MGLCPKPCKELPLLDQADELNTALCLTKIKHRSAATSVGIIKGTCTLDRGVGRSPSINTFGERGAPAGVIFFMNLCLKNP